MYAVIRSGGKQYRVEPGKTIRVERLEGKVGGKVTFDEVIAVRTDEKKILGGEHAAKAKITGKIVAARPRPEAQGAEVQDGRAIQNSDRPSAELYCRGSRRNPTLIEVCQWHIKRAAGHLLTDATRMDSGSESSGLAGRW